MDIARRISTAPGASNGREADEDGRLLALLAQERRSGDVAIVSIARESAMSSGTTSMDSPFGNLHRQESAMREAQYKRRFEHTNPLMVEVSNLLAEDEVFQ